MRLFTGIIGAIGFLAGAALLFAAYNVTTILSRAADASAVQVTQVYSQASFYGIIAVACFAIAVLMQLVSLGTLINENTAATYAASNAQLEQAKAAEIKSRSSENKVSSVSK